MDSKEGRVLENFFFLIGEEFIRLGIESPFIRIELRVTARRSSQSFLKEINTEYSLEGLILLNCGDGKDS